MKRTTWILVGTVIALAIIAFFVLRQPGEVSTTEGSGTMLVSYDSATVDRLEVNASGTSVVLEKQGNGWMLTSPLRYRADQTVVTAAVGKGKNIEVKNVVSSNPEKQRVFQVDSSGTLVQMYAGGNLVAAFRVGKPSASYTETYVRREGSDDVYLADGMFSYTFVQQSKDWRDKSIYRNEPDLVKSVTYKYGDTTFTLAMNDSLWRLNGDSVSQPTMRSVLGSLANLQADGFVDSALSAPPTQVALIDVDGTQIRFCQNKGTSNYLVQTSQSPQWYEVQEWRAGQVLKRKNDF
ncbi:MAG: hypothetical protein H6Q30_311 [Bacteroidetes bacterium]|nr:hypothetical protein [Bacteroidota bacterium]